jgi:hypothetical protein
MKKNMSKVFIEILNENEKETLLSLGPYFEKKSVLAGGTSLMLQIPIRKSYDFDLFFPYEIPGDFLRSVSKIFESDIRVLINNSDELTFIAHKEIKISFIYFPFPRKYESVIEDRVSLSSFKDIASDKAYAIGRRPEYRDYVDLFIILKDGFKIEQTILDAKEKFGGEFSEKLFLSQLVYFEDIKDFSVDFIKKNYTVEEIKDFFKKEVYKLQSGIMTQ